MSNPFCKYVITLPYPEVPPQKTDAAAVKRILTAYAGPVSEMTAVTQYLYFHLIALMQGQTAVSDAFSCIAMTEMEHLNCLGKLITAFGGDPAYRCFQTNGKPVWWSGNLVSYPKQIPQMLRQAVASEQAAVREYRQLAKSLDGPAKKLIERIIMDEEHHIDLFQDLLTQCE